MSYGCGGSGSSSARGEVKVAVCVLRGKGRVVVMCRGKDARR